MPLWLFLTLGAGLTWLYFTQNSAASPAATPGTGTVGSGTASQQFWVGEKITVPANTHMFSDAALTNDVGIWPGGQGTITTVDDTHNAVGFVGPSGTGLDGKGAPAYVPASALFT